MKLHFSHSKQHIAQIKINVEVNKYTGTLILSARIRNESCNQRFRPKLYPWNTLILPLSYFLAEMRDKMKAWIQSILLLGNDKQKVVANGYPYLREDCILARSVEGVDMQMLLDPLEQLMRSFA